MIRSTPKSENDKEVFFKFERLRTAAQPFFAILLVVCDSCGNRNIEPIINADLLYPAYA